LSPEQWLAVRETLDPPASSAVGERQRLATTVGVFEQTAGRLVGTSGDVGGTFTGFRRQRQLDCIDETVNTATLLLMLEREGLLHWHEPGPPVGRGNVIHAWPHRTATVRERATGRLFVLDSWFRDNGDPADVVPVEQWLDGWSPTLGTAARQVPGT